MNSTISHLSTSVCVLAVLAGSGTAGAQSRGSDQPMQLDTLVVQGPVGQEERADSRDDYARRTTATATKTTTPVLETPQAISTVTRRQLDEQNPQTVGNALRYTAGVLSERDATSRYDSVFLRGFGGFGVATDFVGFLDGLKLPRGQAFAVTSIDPFLLDRIEVIKGPSALLYGQISPGGLVNQISRMPSTTPYNELRVEAGSHGRIQSGLTSQGPIDRDGRLSYSFSAIGRLADTRYDDVEEQRFGIAPALTWQPTADTKLTVSGFYQRDPKGGYFNSLYPRSRAPAYRGFLNRELNIGDPGFDSFKREQYGVGYSFEHRFNDMVSLHSSLRYGEVETDFRSLQMAGPVSAAGTIPRIALNSIEDARRLSSDNHLQFDLRGFGAEHTLLTGVDYQNGSSNWQYRFGPATALNIVSPRYYQPAGPLATIIDKKEDLTQAGIYLQDQIKLGGFRATLGLRHDWTEQSTLDRLTGTKQSQSSEKTSYRAGLLYLFDNGLAPYVSYSTSFEPVSGSDAAGAPFRPKTGEQYEAGIKYQPGIMNALLTFSAFDIRQQNVLTPGATPGFNVQQGEIRSRGLEFEARGEILEGLDIIAAATLLDTEVTRSTDLTTIGKRPQAVPNQFGSLWANYRFATGPLAGLSIGGGVRVVGASFSDDANTIRTAGYAVVDAAIRYDLAKLHPSLKGAEATLNVSNLFDKDYYTSCSSNTYCQFGAGREVLAGLRYRW
ncbi:TonB-dependent siderophore receptor [Bosea sp. ASV33]|uniref:TonB-dependent siderophore receptor n=1 Tax=Bosea sp. ASV33 TaxID=2795106 RepID=UPI0018EBAE06|nr:TonB-dependent siderophore receptor [Bosea sp. ASV33]